MTCATCGRDLKDERGPDCWVCWARKRDEAKRKKSDVLREALRATQPPKPVLTWEPLDRPRNWPEDSPTVRLAFDSKGYPFNMIDRGDPHAFCFPGLWCDQCENRVEESLEDAAGMGNAW